MGEGLPTELFSSPDVVVRYVPARGSTCFVTFSSLGANKKTGFGESFLRGQGFAAFHIIASWDHWYQSDDVHSAIGQVRGLLDENSYDQIILYGASMGGFGALAFSRLLRADQVIAFAPQYTIDPAKPPFETRWRREASLLNFKFDNMPEQICRSARKTIAYDPYSSDRHHVELFARFPNLDLVPIPFAGHHPGEVLLQDKILQSLIRGVADHKVDRSDIYRRLHLSRRKSVRYWNALAEKARSRRPALALTFVESGLALAPADAVLLLMRLNLLIDTQQFEEATAHARELAIAMPSHAGVWRAVAKAAWGHRKFQEAVAAARKAVALRPNDADLRRFLLGMLVKTGQFREALDVGKVAIILDGGPISTYAQTIAAAIECGHGVDAMALLQVAKKVGGADSSVTKILGELESKALAIYDADCRAA